MENQKSYLNHTARGLVGFDEKGPSYINFPLVFCGPERKLRLRVKNDTGYIDLSLGIDRRRPNNANHDGEIGQIINKNIGKKTTKNTNKCIQMRIPRQGLQGGATQPRFSPLR